MHTAGGVEARETKAHGEDAFSVAGDLVLLASDHEGIIVLEQLQPLTLWLVSIPISRQRLFKVHSTAMTYILITISHDGNFILRKFQEGHKEKYCNVPRQGVR